MTRTVTVDLGSHEIAIYAKVERDGIEEWYIAYNDSITTFGCGSTPEKALKEFSDYVRSYYKELKEHEGRLSPRLQRHLEILEVA